MLQEDREAIQKMKADFEALADLSENDFKGHTSFARKMNHYSTVYTIATRNVPKAEYPGYDVGDLLYMDFQEMLTRYLLRYKDFHLTSTNEIFLKVLSIWDHYKVLMKWNIKAFSYLSRYYIVNHSKPSLKQVALSIFLEQIFKKEAPLISGVMQEMLVKERAGEAVNEEHIQNAAELFSAMKVDGSQNIYRETFLLPYIQRTKEDYEKLLLQWMSLPTATDFLERIQSALGEEKKRARYFLYDDEKFIMSNVEESLVNSPITHRRLLKSDDGFAKMLLARQEPQLKQCYELFSRRQSGLKELSAVLLKVIQYEGEQLFQKYEAEESKFNIVEYVQEMMKLQEVYPKIKAHCFQMDFVLSKSIRDGLESVFNGCVKMESKFSGKEHEVKFSDLLACYINIVLQEDSSLTFDDEVDRIVETIAYITDRDVFLLSLQEKMAERILSPLRRFNAAKERTLVTRIRQRCGPASTTYLEGMLDDFNLSNAFHAMTVLSNRGQAPAFEVSLLVTKKGMWISKLSTADTIKIPAKIQSVLENLREAYLEGTSGRQLAWTHENASAEVLAHFPGGNQTIFLSCPQALVLFMFNTEKDTVLLKECCDAYNMTIEMLQEILPPILKARILKRKGTSKDPEMGDELSFNEAYAVKKMRLRLPPTLKKMSVIANDEVTQKANQDRRPAIDACIVKIMKSRWTITHTKLLEECTRQLSSFFYS
ncbi:cullin 1 [Strigomonas culicis]|uniref:Cullin 1 n=1 Tax=Strigomonas culicis TaxID=28005 RepID=S9TS41_9TRYP|nr:cullin 1 [Strigomonas culicis]|eukprot:EPY21192.1 cullin 1 [Strigomonas culicis]